MNTFMLSPCGISLLLADKAEEEKKLLNRYANAKEKDVPPSAHADLSVMIEQSAEMLKHCDLAKVRLISAELNSLTLFYRDAFPIRNDYHYLLTTDTWLGYECALLIKEWLLGKGAACGVFRQKDLQTQDVEAFHMALAEMAPQLIQIIQDYRRRNYSIIFNLTAGFKAVQGFLQTLGMFHADELIYVFERTAHLMHIPKIPVQITGIEPIRDHLHIFRRIAANLPVSPQDIEPIPETMILELGNDVALSAWGSIFWAEAKKALYILKLYPPICDKVRFANRFVHETNGLLEDRLIILNERIDQLCVFILTGKNPEALRFKVLQGKPVPGATHEFYAWSDRNAKRCYGHYEGNSFVIDQLGEHLK